MALYAHHGGQGKWYVSILVGDARPDRLVDNLPWVSTVGRVSCNKSIPPAAIIHFGSHGSVCISVVHGMRPASGLFGYPGIGT
jgi:hypothetical protein